MSRPTITFVSGDAAKVAEVTAALSTCLGEFVFLVDYMMFEISTSTWMKYKEKSMKCEQATEKVDGFVMVEDTSMCFNAFGGMPGPYIKYFVEAIGPSGLHLMLEGFDDKRAQAVCAIAFTPGRGQPIVVVKGVVEGRIVAPRGKNLFGGDSFFEPMGGTKTFAEMTTEENYAISHRSKALAALRETLEKKS